MLQRGLDYAAATVIICAKCAAMLVLAAEILSFSPVADAAAALGAAVLLNSQGRRMRTRAKHRSGPKTGIASDDTPSRISVRVFRQTVRYQGCRPGQQQGGSCPGTRSHPGRIPAVRTLTGARATRFGSRIAGKTPASPARCRMERAILTGRRPDAPVSAAPNPVLFKAAAGQRVAAGR